MPFQKGYYYNSLMGGSFSIKSVLPAIFPNDKSLDYKNLEGVQNGSEAMYIFHTLEYMNEGEQQIARNNYFFPYISSISLLYTPVFS